MFGAIHEHRAGTKLYAVIGGKRFYVSHGGGNDDERKGRCSNTTILSN